MGWKKHNGRGESQAKRKTVRVAIRQDAGGRHALRVSIGRDILDRLGLSVSARVDFFWGEAAHRGWVRIAHSAVGDYALALHRSAQGEKASLMLVVGCLPEWMRREKRAVVEAKFTINPDREIEIRLPSDFLKDYDKKFPDENRGRPPAHTVRHSPTDRALHNGAEVTSE